MTNIFVFTAAKPVAQENLERSIRSPIERETALNSFSSTERDALSEIEALAGGFYASGAQPGRNETYWSKMHRGDYVIGAFNGQYRYIARVIRKYKSRQFAEAVWRQPEDGQPFELVYFLTEPIAVSVAYDDAADYLNAGYRGFTKISDKKIGRISQDFGTLDAFFDHTFGCKPNREKRTLSESFQDVAKLWPDYFAGEIVDSESECFDLIERSIPDLLMGEMYTPHSKLFAKGSTGKGRITASPWVALFDSRVTDRATSGFYPVYLFSTDMAILYLGIGFGAQQFTDTFGAQRGREKLRQAVSKVRPLFSEMLSGQVTDTEIDLKSGGSKLHSGYEAGMIYVFGKYRVPDLPEDESLLADLRNAASLYEHMIRDPLMPSVDELVASGADSRSAIEDATVKTIDFVPRTRHKRHAKAQLPSNRKPRRSKQSQKTGLAGEEIVLAEELRKLRSRGQESLAEHVKPHFKNEEYPGWDITSFDESGNEIFIEVKSSVSKSISSVELTRNEWEAAQNPKNSDKYYLYLVTGVFSKQPTIHRLLNPAKHVEDGVLNIYPSVFLLPLTAATPDS